MGKSSLLNLLLKKERAIVTEIAGTTRDVIEDTVNIGDLILNISDTAGIRDTEDIVEKIGIKKSLEVLSKTDLVIYIISADENLSKSDIDMLSKIQNKGIKNIVLINKMDRVVKSIFDASVEQLEGIDVKNIIECSLINNINDMDSGILKITDKIKQMFVLDDINIQEEIIITNKWHEQCLKDAVINLDNVLNEINKKMPQDIFVMEIKEATNNLGKITGSNISEDILDTLFKNFCVGK